MTGKGKGRVLLRKPDDKAVFGVKLDGEEVNAKWEAEKGGLVWGFELNSELQEGSTIRLSFGDCSLELKPDITDPFRVGSPVPREVLLKSLETTQELLELEPDSKWTRLSLILILRTIGECPAEEILAHYDKLVEVDPMRRGYYADMKEKVAEEEAFLRQL